MDISFPVASRRSSMFPEGNVPGYVCNPGSPRERDAASQSHTSSIPTRAMPHSWKLAPAAHHVLLSILVMTSPAPDVWPSILTDYTYDSELDIADGVPHSVSTQRLVPSGNQGYIRNLGRYESSTDNQGRRWDFLTGGGPRPGEGVYFALTSIRSCKMCGKYCRSSTCDRKSRK